MKVLIVLCFVAGALANCPENQHYESCGTKCPLTCDNYRDPPRACVLMCNPGCHCDAGYVKTGDGECVLPEKCPSKASGSDEQKTCLAEPDEGMCRGYFPMYYYDVQSGTCKEFIYGGCQGNGNRYGSEEECMEQCGDLKPRHSSKAVCELPAETGMCRGYFPKYFFDSTSGQCKKFIYGGCGGNENNFKSEEECNSACASRAVCGENERHNDCGTACPLTCDNFLNPPKFCNLMCVIGCECAEGYVRSADGRCVLPDNCPAPLASDSSVCDQEKVVGPCRAAFRKFFFNKQTGQCEKFIYGGCQGNGNRFNSKSECESTCVALASDSSVCDQEKVVGPCRAAFRKFFFNKQTGQCEKFIYGGCQGNGNRFNSKSECESTCVA